MFKKKNEIVTLDSPEAVLEAIGAKDFRSISKKQIIEFVSQIPNMDKDVALACINQFPKFVDNAKNIIDALERSVHYALENDQESEDAVIKTYQEAIVVLKERASDPNISLEEARQLALDITDIADKIAALHKSKQEFAMSLHNRYYAVLMTIVVASSTLLGAKLLNKKY